MHRKVRKQHITFTSTQRQTGLAHIVEHIHENAKVEIRGGKCPIAVTTDSTDNKAAKAPKKQYEPP